MINVSDRLTAKTVENILTDAREIAWQKGDVNTSTSGTVATALNEIDDKLTVLALGVKTSISTSPTTIYKSTQTNVTITAKMVNANDGDDITLDVYSGTSSTPIMTAVADASIQMTTPITMTNNSIVFTVKGTANGMALPNNTATLEAWNAIYYGFGSVDTAIVNAKKYSPTKTAVHTYTDTCTHGGDNFFILVPTDVTNVTSFKTSGAPVAMDQYDKTINGISYHVKKTQAPYPINTELSIQAEVS